MHVIAAKTIRESADEYTNARKPLTEWLATVEKAKWTSIEEIRTLFPKTDSVRVASGNDVYVFNIKGNTYRLIAAIHFNRGKVYILRFLTHADYDKDAWKKQL
jgi:mRNA interferase HigB